MDYISGKTTQETAERNKKLIRPLDRLQREYINRIPGLEREALSNNRNISRSLRELTDVLLVFNAEPTVEQLKDAYRQLIDKADKYISHADEDINPEEKVNWANGIKSLAETGLADLNSALRNNEFAPGELKLPANGYLFPEEPERIEKERALRESEKNLEEIPQPENSNDMPVHNDEISLTSYAMEQIIERFDTLPDMRSKLALYADLVSADDLGLVRAGCDTKLLNILQDHMMQDKDGQLRPDAGNIVNEVAEAVAEWRLAAYRETVSSGNKDAKWKKDFIRAGSLIKSLSMDESFISRFGVDMSEVLPLTNEKMISITTPEELEGVREITADLEGISLARQHALACEYRKELEKSLPDLIIDDDYVTSLNQMKGEIDGAVRDSEKYRYNEELSEISGKIASLSHIAGLKSAGRSQYIARDSASNTAARIGRFMEKEALDSDWYAEGNTVRESLLYVMEFTDYGKYTKYVEKEEVLKRRAEDIRLSGEVLNGFFESQSGSSRDTLKKLAAANDEKKEESIARMAVIIEKRYGLGKEFSVELAKAAKERIDWVKNAGADPVHQWESTAEFMKDAVKNISNERMNDYRISKKGNTVKAEHQPKLRGEILDRIKDAEVVEEDGPAYAASLRGLLDEPDSFDMMKDMFDTKKNYRILNWNSSEYNNAKAALDSFTKERDKLIRMTDKYAAGQMTEEEKKELSRQIAITGSKRDRCIETLDAYIVKEGRGDAAGKSQAAGYARIAGAKGLMDIFMKTDKNLSNQLSGLVKQAVKEDRVKVKSYSELYREEYKKAGRDGVKDRHRKAAKAARTVSRRQDPPVM